MKEFALASLVFLLAGPSLAQQEDVFAVRTVLVSVTDGEGAPVSGLGAVDFALAERGHGRSGGASVVPVGTVPVPVQFVAKAQLVQKCLQSGNPDSIGTSPLVMALDAFFLDVLGQLLQLLQRVVAKQYLVRESSRNPLAVGRTGVAPGELGDDFGYPRCVGDRRPVVELGAVAATCALTPPTHAIFAAGATPTSVAVAPWDPATLLVALWNRGEVVAVPTGSRSNDSA